MKLSESYKKRLMDLSGINLIKETKLSYMSDEDPVDDYGPTESEIMVDILSGEIQQNKEIIELADNLNNNILETFEKIKPVISKILDKHGFEKNSDERFSAANIIIYRLNLSKLYGENLIDEL